MEVFEIFLLPFLKDLHYLCSIDQVQTCLDKESWLTMPEKVLLKRDFLVYSSISKIQSMD